MKKLALAKPKMTLVGAGPKMAKPNIMRSRQLLAFVPDEPNPMVGVVSGKTPEETLKRPIDAVGEAFRKAAKDSRQKELHMHSGYGAEYAVVVFQDNEQTNEFFRAIGYPEPKDVYIDGLVLAELLKVKLPEPKVQMKKLKAIHNPKLTRLAKPL